MGAWEPGRLGVEQEHACSRAGRGSNSSALKGRNSLCCAHRCGSRASSGSAALGSASEAVAPLFLDLRSFSALRRAERERVAPSAAAVPAAAEARHRRVLVAASADGMASAVVRSRSLVSMTPNCGPLASSSNDLQAQPTRRERKTLSRDVQQAKGQLLLRRQASRQEQQGMASSNDVSLRQRATQACGTAAQTSMLPFTASPVSTST